MGSRATELTGGRKGRIRGGEEIRTEGVLVWDGRDDDARIGKLERREEPEKLGEPSKDRDLVSGVVRRGRLIEVIVRQSAAEGNEEKLKTNAGCDGVDDVSSRRKSADLGRVADADLEHPGRVLLRRRGFRQASLDRLQVRPRKIASAL